ncbi:hypothetical protein [Pantoea rwandensis]|uniref:Uncharacterized protein n=1 Tax=Pantoea rwandensis TaxID=1076550 RepID=A0A1X1CNX0_9GAMM|nr:hypothetical protein [Pantoea rwandensis]ORM66108.1 hypothetical protein HA51_24000 [Pantoea rwandensis]
MSFKKFLFLFFLAFLSGFWAFYYLSLNINFSKAPTPWVLLTLLLFPSGYCVQALFKVPEANEHTSLSSDELRRLKPIIRIKTRRLSILATYYLISAMIVAIGFYAIPNSSENYIYFISLSGALITSSLCSFFYIKSIMDEAQEFKSKLIHRSEELKKRKEILEKANKEVD